MQSNDNPDIIINVYRDDEWFAIAIAWKRCAFLKKCVLNMQPRAGTLELEEVSKCSSPGDPMNNFACAGVRRIGRSLGRSRPPLFLTHLSGSDGGRRVERSCAEAVAKKSRLQPEATCIAFCTDERRRKRCRWRGKAVMVGQAHRRPERFRPGAGSIGTNADDAVPHYLVR